MERTTGRPEIRIAVIDGPVAPHPDLVASVWNGERPERKGSHHDHGTFVTGILAARRGSPAPAICPSCSFLILPIFGADMGSTDLAPRVYSSDLAEAILEAVSRGASVINLSVAAARPSTRSDPQLQRALDHAAKAGCVVVAAAGNQGVLASSSITRHPWVIPVSAFTLTGRPIAQANLGASIGRGGLGGPGEGVTSLSEKGGYIKGGGTSAAAAFVTGAVALLWALLPTIEAQALVWGLKTRRRMTRPSVAPPILDAEGAYQALIR
ncbi:S8 family serine peptidase [Actinoplanes sp. NPDC023936]|uniref:S8 family peptidase n=1 Tax=Actinoplanes sp. NPDC023936 TaxID=3154910 RepID=UPI00340EB63B